MPIAAIFPKTLLVCAFRRNADFVYNKSKSSRGKQNFAYINFYGFIALHLLIFFSVVEPNFFTVKMKGKKTQLRRTITNDNGNFFIRFTFEFIVEQQKLKPAPWLLKKKLICFLNFGLFGVKMTQIFQMRSYNSMRLLRKFFEGLIVRVSL